MYQFTTFYPLAKRKCYFRSTRECARELKKVVEVTNKYRSSINLLQLSLGEIESGSKMLHIDLKTEPDAMMLLGSESEISLDNLMKPEEVPN